MFNIFYNSVANLRCCSELRCVVINWIPMQTSYRRICIRRVFLQSALSNDGLGYLSKKHWCEEKMIIIISAMIQEKILKYLSLLIAHWRENDEKSKSRISSNLEIFLSLIDKKIKWYNSILNYLPEWMPFCSFRACRHRVSFCHEHVGASALRNIEQRFYHKVSYKQEEHVINRRNNRSNLNQSAFTIL